VITLRPAALSDCQCLWEWANDPVVRAASFDSRPIPLPDHQRWLQRKLADRSCRLFIVLDDGRPIGQVRLEQSSGTEAEIHVSLDAAARGAGRGTAAVKAACDIAAGAGVTRVVAHVKPDNPASLRAFEKAGFIRTGDVAAHGHQAERLMWRSSDR
jgi:RimJ/RimL family protein N-acetyltransferase